jgi:hypothetical protein
VKKKAISPVNANKGLVVDKNDKSTRVLLLSMFFEVLMDNRRDHKIKLVII